MRSTGSMVLERLAERRFQNFSDAAEMVLGALGEDMPGTVVLGKLDPDEGLYRILDTSGGARGALTRGATLPLAASANGPEPGGQNGHPAATSDAGLDRGFLRALSFEACIASPLETSDGKVVGALCALAPETGVYRPDHLALLTVAARVLSYEWESVEMRAELRRLKVQLRDGERTDHETGLPHRASFLDLVDREWHLVKRGSVAQSVVVAFRVQVNGSEGANPAMSTLALKDAAEVLAGNVRITDHVGRIGEMGLGAVLVGSHGLPGARAFVRRFETSLERVTSTRPVRIGIWSGAQLINDCDSATEALERAERTALSVGSHGPSTPPPVPSTPPPGP